METRTDEIADGIHRISTFVPEAGLTFNQYLVVDEEPLLFHLGLRALFPAVADAVDRIVPRDRLRWLAFGHVEADECGSMNEWLAAAPDATVMHGGLGCVVSVNDLADRAPRPLDDGEVVELGERRVRYRSTPHVPHGWDAGLLFEETTRTLLCGDLFTIAGETDASTDADLVEPAIGVEEAFGYSSLCPSTPGTIRELAGLGAETLGLMHGPAFTGDVAAALDGLAGYYEGRLAG